MKKTIIFLMLLIPLFAFAETKEERISMRHEVRVGWGDQIFETLVWHEPTSIVTSSVADRTFDYNERYRYHQHLWAEYQYRFNYWFGLGVMMDCSEVGWDVVTRNGSGEELARDRHHYFYDLVVMPTARFTYFHHPNVNLYSGLGIGACINGGSETDAYGHKTLCGLATNVTVIGLSANYGRWFWIAEYGGMYALRDKNTVFMAKSRMVSVGLGARF